MGRRSASSSFSIQMDFHHAFCPTCAVATLVPVPIASEIIKHNRTITCINAHSFIPQFVGILPQPEADALPDLFGNGKEVAQ